MESINLQPNTIHFIDIDDEHKLFLHVPTLQLYPLGKDDTDLVEFLEFYKKNGSEDTNAK